MRFGRSLTGKWLYLLAFALALAGQWGFAQSFAVPTGDEPDGKLYLSLARHLRSDGIYAADTPAGTVFLTYLRLPGYPWMLAGVFALCGDKNEPAVRGFQALLATFTCIGVAWLAHLWEPDPAGRKRSALGAFALAALCPFTAIYSAVIQAETLALFVSVLLLLAATWALRARTRAAATMRWAVAGLVAGAAQMVRPEAGLFAAAVGGVLVGAGWLKSGRDHWRARLSGVLRDGAVFSLAFVVVLVPWTVRNARVFHVFAPLPPVEVKLPGERDYHGFRAWYKTWADSEWTLEPYYWAMTDGQPATMQDLPPRAMDSEAERAQTAALFARYNAPASSDTASAPPAGLTPGLDEEFGRLARDRIARAPWRYHVLLPLRRAVNLWFSPHATYYDFDGPAFPPPGARPGMEPNFWPLVFLLLVGVYTVLGLAGLWRLARVRPPARVQEARCWLAFVLLVTLPRWVYLATLENTEPRYMVELFPCVCVLGGLARFRPGSPPSGPGMRTLAAALGDTSPTGSGANVPELGRLLTGRF